MPMFGFVCQECGESFEELVLSASRINEVVCPSCNSGQVEKQLSRIAAPSFSTGSSSSSSAACATGST
ncbi:MAG: zinc ribbon domain-containing protein [Anaerolineales bacterium]|nr:zinc ribbon domain-containing protein [Anaerolineales bacterium]